MSEEKITLSAKRKNIQTLLDYCMDNRILFTVSPKGLVAEEFDILLSISGIKEALALGMFVKEHKFEVLGLPENSKPKSLSNISKKQDSIENEKTAVNETPKVEQQSTSAVLNF